MLLNEDAQSGFKLRPQWKVCAARLRLHGLNITGGSVNALPHPDELHLKSMLRRHNSTSVCLLFGLARAQLHVMLARIVGIVSIARKTEGPAGSVNEKSATVPRGKSVMTLKTPRNLVPNRYIWNAAGVSPDCFGCY
jgi:hypothetical protein